LGIASIHAAREDEPLQRGRRRLDKLEFGVAAQPGVANFEGAERGEPQETGKGKIASQNGVRRDVAVVGDEGNIVGDVTGVDVYGGACDAGEGKMGEGGDGGSEGDDEPLGSNRGR
jgi:hypothetical protein